MEQKFTRQICDEEPGLDYFNARYLGAALGRFLSPDSGNAGADLEHPQSWNGYAYVANIPMGNVDPSGMNWLSSIGDFFRGLGGDFGGIFGGGGGPQYCESYTGSCGGGGGSGAGVAGGYWIEDSGGPGSGNVVGLPEAGGGGGDGGVRFKATGIGVAPRAPQTVSAPTKGGLSGKNRLTPGQLQTIKNAAQTDARTCAGTFSAGMGAFGVRFSLRAFDSQIQNIRYLQYPNLATNPLGPLSSVEVQAFRGSIALYPNFFTDTSARQAGIVVRENLHVYISWNDSNIFSVFQGRGITANEVNQFTRYSNTDGITTWILRGCK